MYADSYYQPADPKPYPRCTVTLEECERPVPTSSGDEGFIFITVEVDVLPGGELRAELVDSGAVGYEWPTRTQSDTVELTPEEAERALDSAADLESLGDW